MNPTLNTFRVAYPQGSLISDLLAIDHGQYIVRVSVEIDGVTRSTGLAAAQTVELAEDQARQRAITVLTVDQESSTDQVTSPPHHHAQTSVAAEPRIPSSPTPTSSPNSTPAFTAKSLESTPEVKATPSSSPLDTQPLSTQPTPPPEPTEPLPETVEPPYPTEKPEKKPSPAPEPTVTFPETMESLSGTEDVSASEPPLFQEQTPPPESSWESDAIPSPSPEAAKKEAEVDIQSQPKSDTPIDFSEILARTNVELRRLGWNNQQGRDYLIETYGKRSRQLLTDEELLDFLHHLELEPTPE